MRDVNWWLMALAFLLGLVLTLGLMIRRVTREVPVSHTLTAGGVGAGAAATGAAAKLHGGAGKAGAKVAGADILEEDPYGSGSIRVTRRAAAPAGYTIKGDKDTGRYFGPGSPDYDAIEAEVWFANEESAEKAGFLRWDAKAGSRLDAGSAAARTVVTGGTGTPDSSATVVTGGGSTADTTAVVTGGTAAAAAAAKFVSADEVEAGPYGKGSAKAGAGGAGPAGWTVKGNADSMLFHGPDSPAYEVTIAEVWFVDEATARAAGFQHWDVKRR